jgi:hypothetical protein
VKVLQSIFLYIVLFYVSSFTSLSQVSKKSDYERTINVSTFIKMLTDTSTTDIEIFNLNIVADISDSRYTYGAFHIISDINWDSISGYPPIIIHKNVSIDKVRFGQRTIMPRLIFKGKLHMERIEVYGDLSFYDCQFTKDAYIVNMETYFLTFTKCHFDDVVLESVDAEKIYFRKCKFDDGFNIYQDNNILNVNISHSHINGHSSLASLRGGGDISIDHSKFEKTEATDRIDLGGIGFFHKITLKHDTFDLPFLLTNTSVNDKIDVEHTLFNKGISLESTSLPEQNCDIRWPYVADGNIFILEGIRRFDAKTRLVDSVEGDYHALVKSYSQLLRAYKNNGDQESYNACYIEMKDTQTKRCAYMYQKAPSINSYFEWKLNRFLKLFCDYGTNPVKSLIFSLMIILFFGMMYVIFPSNEGEKVNLKLIWRGLTKSRKMRRTELNLLGNQILEAFALSMNAFVTLGYGDMPARGISRYLAVLEGLTGWFLLSIFSASLISQILQ